MFFHSIFKDRIISHEMNFDLFNFLNMWKIIVKVLKYFFFLYAVVIIVCEIIFPLDKRDWTNTGVSKPVIIPGNPRCCWIMIGWFMAFNATFNNISVISWWSVLLEEETGVHEENHRPVASHWQTLSHNVVSSTPRHEQGLNSQH